MKTKKTPFIYFAAGLFTCILISSCNSSENKNEQTSQDKPEAPLLAPTCLLPATGEPTLDLTTHVLEENEGNFEISEFKPYNINTGTGIVLPQKADEIVNDHFCALRDSAASIVRNEPSCSNAVKAVRILIGLGSGLDKIDLIYQPVALCNPVIAGNSATFQVVEGASPKFYVHNATGFSVITNTGVCKTYTQHIQIRHTKTTSPSAFIKGKDIESVIYSFQEIGQLIQDNPHNKVTIWNAIGKRIVDANPDSVYYHSILLGPEQLQGPQPFTIYGPFVNKFANLAHLCPPSCGELVFRIKP